MTPLKISSPGQFRWLVVFATLLGMACLFHRFVEVGFTNSQSQDTSTPPQQKKLFMDVPSKLPLKVSVRNLNNKNWANDLEIEVVNRSGKPIYYLSFMVILPGVKGELGSDVGFWLKYGRGELNDFATPLEKDDVPIQPGEKYILKIPASSAKGWEYLRDKGGKGEPGKVQLLFQSLNFGDGTGFAGSDAKNMNIHRKINSNCDPPPNRSPESSTLLANSSYRQALGR